MRLKEAGWQQRFLDDLIGERPFDLIECTVNDSGPAAAAAEVSVVWSLHQILQPCAAPLTRKQNMIGVVSCSAAPVVAQVSTHHETRAPHHSLGQPLIQFSVQRSPHHASPSSVQGIELPGRRVRQCKAVAHRRRALLAIPALMWAVARQPAQAAENAGGVDSASSPLIQGESIMHSTYRRGDINAHGAAACSWSTLIFINGALYLQSC